MERFIIRLSGDEAKTGKVPLYSSLDSLTGLSQSLIMISHFAETRKIRRRNFKDLESPLRLSGARQGSFELIIELASWAGTVVAGGVLWDFVKGTYKKTIGQKVDDDVEGLQHSDGGDYGALVQAIEPSVRKGHNIINHGASQINIFMDGDRENSITFDTKSKEYLYEDVFNDETRIQRFMVTSFDGRNRTGRLFDIELEMGFSFRLEADADNQSLEIIADAARAYALRRLRFTDEIEISCVFNSIDAPDGRMKLLRVFTARKDITQIRGI